MKKIFILLSLVCASINSFGQCAASANTYTFNYSGKTYLIVREKKTWTEAAACAVSLGGKLAEINSVAIQNEVYSRLANNASINTSSTTAADGGGAAYVWIGGTDKVTEGTWKWDGTNSGGGTAFWQGLANGSPIGGQYNNWGNEPDDYNNNQDGLAIALTNWPMGVAGEWNDLALTDQLYFVVEKPCNIPAANYTSTVPVNKTVQYTYTGTTPVDSVRWDFGDGGTSTAMNPTHTFLADGQYNVCVTAYNGCGQHKYCNQLPLAINDLEGMDHISIYPNPVRDVINISSDKYNLNQAAYYILNIYGQNVLSGKLHTAITCSVLPKGIYFLHLNHDDKRLVYKFVKQ